MRVHWTSAALAHLVLIHEYIATDSPRYAQRVIDRLTRRSEQLASFPLSGRMVLDYELLDTREIIEGAYRIIYRVKPDQIDILAVVHSAQSLPIDL